MDYSFIYLIHILFGGPLLIYGGYIGKTLTDKYNDEENVNVFLTLIVVGLAVILYHGYKLLKMKGMIE